MIRFAVSGILLLAASAAADDSRPYMEARLSGDLTIQGWLDTGPAITLNTVVGPVQLPLDRVQGVVRTNETTTVLLERGDRLSGEIRTPLLLATESGRVEIPIERLRRLSRIDPPKPGAAQPAPDAPALLLLAEPLRIRVDEEGKLTLLGQATTAADLPALLGRVQGLGPRTPIVIEADKATKTATVVELFRVLPGLGYSNFRFEPLE